MLDSREPPHHPKSAHAKKRVKIFNFGAILGRALASLLKIWMMGMPPGQNNVCHVHSLCHGSALAPIGNCMPQNRAFCFDQHLHPPMGANSAVARFAEPKPEKEACKAAMPFEVGSIHHANCFQATLAQILPAAEKQFKATHVVSVDTTPSQVVDNCK